MPQRLRLAAALSVLALAAAQGCGGVQFANAGTDAGSCVGSLVLGNATLNGQTQTLSRFQDLCFLACVVCTSEAFVSWSIAAPDMCRGSAAGPAAGGDAIVDAATDAFMNTSALHGNYFLDDAGDLEENATAAVRSLLAGMPRRDLMLLETQTHLVADFLLEHVRYALHTRAWSRGMNVTWQAFADYVLPYSVLDEKRDLYFRWRPRFQRIFRDVTAGAATITDAMRALADAVPRADSLGVLALSNSGELEIVPGPPVSWRSSVSPAFISVEQVASFGGSCTGTAIVLVAAARSVGIPARLAGCGESVVRHDDHHWIEYWDGASPGPFGDFWHTKEGTSAGNEGGPWDLPSGPMMGCLAGVVPKSAIDSLWAASWTSTTYMPMLW